MVKRLLVERILIGIETDLAALRRADDITWPVYQQDVRARRFVERTLHVLIEACIDIAQHIIADQRLREPESYRDTFAVLVEAGILPETDRYRFEQMAAFRNLLVHYYEKIDDQTVYGIFRNHLADFSFFADRIRAYLDSVGGGP
jgi:uncharacterized protein YutE (UPF0331/DUF86 family)